jgi:carboxypeptidase T
MRHSIRRILPFLSVVTVIAVGMPSTAAGRSGGNFESAIEIRTYRVDHVSTKEARTAIARTGAAIEWIGPSEVVIRARPEVAAELRDRGFRVSELALRDFPPEDARYHNYQEMAETVAAVAAAHPDIVQQFTIGPSYQGRQIVAAKISDNVALDEPEPEVLFDSLHHAREHLTVEMGLFILRMFARGYGVDPRITRLVEEREIWVVFMLNPDGAEYDVEGGFYHSWRKNRQPNDGYPNNPGTDLNRNYGYRWDCCGGSSDFPPDETYHGTAPFSAPEAAALAQFIESRVVDGEQQITAGISFHTYSELVLWPYGYTFQDVPSDMTQDDHDVFVKVGTAMADSTCTPEDGCYIPEQSSDLYITDGTTIDWMYGRHKIFAFTIEMYPKGSFGFYPPDEDIRPQTRRVGKAVLMLTSVADCPYKVIGKQDEYCA